MNIPDTLPVIVLKNINISPCLLCEEKKIPGVTATPVLIN